MSVKTRTRLARVLGVAALATLAMVLLPDAASACPVCFDARDENRQAFLATTAFLSLVPLGMVAGAGMWIRRRSRELDELYRSDETPSDGSTGQDAPTH